MIVYALAHTGGFVKVKLTKHEDRAGAVGWLEETGPEWGGFTFELPEEIPLRRTSLSELYWKLFGNELPVGSPLSDLKVRLFDDINDAYRTDDFTTHTGDYQMSEEKAKAPAKEKKAKAAEEKKAVAKTYPAGKVAEFKPVRAGSIRARIIGLMDGKHTIDQVAKAVDSSRSNLRVTLNCLLRDCGIGHKIDDNENLTVLFPGSKTLADAVAAPEAKPAKKEKKAKAEPAAAAN